MVVGLVPDELVGTGGGVAVEQLLHDLAGGSAHQQTNGGSVARDRVANPDLVAGLVAYEQCGGVARRRPDMYWLWIIIIVALVLAVFGYFGRGRFSR